MTAERAATPAAALIVATATGGERLRRLLGSVAASRDGEMEVIVVDNASGDPGLARLKRRFPQVELIRLERNVGFGRAVNAGARATSADALVLVNDDCVCDPGYVGALARRLDPAANVVMAAGVLREARDPSLIDTAGIEVDRTLLAFDYLNGAPVAALERGVADPLGPCGGAAAYDRAAFLELGGFDEALFAFWEDVDLALRMRLAGGRCALAADALATHEHSATLGSGSARKNHLMGFGRGYVLRKYGGLSPGRAAGILVRDGVVCAGQALVDGNAAGVRGRLAGWRAARPAHRYPGELIEAFDPPGALATLSRRAARRARLRSRPRAPGPDLASPGPRLPAATRPDDPRPLRALALLHVAEASGPARSLAGRLRWLAERAPVHVAVPGEGPASEEYREFAAVSVLPYRALTLPRRPLELWRTLGRLAREARGFRSLIREHRPELVVVATATLPAAQIAARLEGVPVALEAAELLTSGRHPIRELAGKALVASAGALSDVVLACSEAVAAQYGGGRAIVLHPPIEAGYGEGDGAAFRRRLGIDPRSPLVLAAGSITERRGQDVLVRAMPGVRREHPDAVCVIAGEPFPRPADLGFHERLERLAAETGGVSLIGHEPRMADAYAAADVVVSPRRDPEAFGRVACEALAAGTPVVAARTGAVPEILRDGSTALLVPPGDPAALAEAVAKLLGDRELAARLTERGRADVRERFSPAAAIETFSEALGRLLEARGSSAPRGRR